MARKAKTVAKAKSAKTKKTAVKKTATKKTTAKKAAPKAKKIGRRPYSKADIKELRAHSKARTPVEKIAKLTKRTVGSLRQKAMKLGIGLGHQR